MTSSGGPSGCERCFPNVALAVSQSVGLEVRWCRATVGLVLGTKAEALAIMGSGLTELGAGCSGPQRWCQEGQVSDDEWRTAALLAEWLPGMCFPGMVCVAD